jgi:hypothetical protein
LIDQLSTFLFKNPPPGSFRAVTAATAADPAQVSCIPSGKGNGAERNSLN